MMTDCSNVDLIRIGDDPKETAGGRTPCNSLPFTLYCNVIILSTCTLSSRRHLYIRDGMAYPL